jgi:hypothetical protein
VSSLTPWLKSVASFVSFLTFLFFPALAAAQAVNLSWARRDRAGLRLGNLLQKAREMSTEQFKQEVEKGLTGRETEPWEIVYFKLCKSQIPIVEQAIETAALMLGTDKSRGYCLEMICADFLAGANMENENSEVLLQSALRFFKFLPREERQAFLHHVTEKPS